MSSDNNTDKKQNDIVLELVNILQYKLSIPSFQRRYVWNCKDGEEKGDVTIFWNDLQDHIEDCLNKPDLKYLFGCVILHGNIDGCTFNIIDGQQRITTCVILLESILEFVINELYEIADREKVITITSDIKNAIQSGSSFNLTVASTNVNFFNSYIAKYPPKFTDEEKNTLKEDIKGDDNHKTLYDAKKFFLTKIQKIYEDIKKIIDKESLTKDEKEKKTADETINKLQIIVSTLLHNFEVVTIKRDDLTEAHRLFETINARGKPLTQTDIIKNYAFTLLDNTSFDVESEWSNLNDLNNSHLTAFIRYYYVSKYGSISDRYLFTNISNKINSNDNPAKAMQTFLQNLTKNVEYYKELVINGSYNTDDLSHRINEIKLLDYSIHCPLYFSMKNKGFSNDQMANILWLLEVYLVRNNKICGNTTNKIWTTISSLSKEISSETRQSNESIELFIERLYRTTYSKLYKQLTDETSTIFLASKELVVNKLKNKIWKDNGQPKVLLKMVELTFKAGTLNNMSLEHIYPKEPKTGEWTTFNDQKSLCFTIGNMILMNLNENKEIQNENYTNKRTFYSKTTTSPMAKDIAAHYEDWTPSTVLSRSESISQTIADNWVIKSYDDITGKKKDKKDKKEESQ